MSEAAMNPNTARSHSTSRGRLVLSPLVASLSLVIPLVFAACDGASPPPQTQSNAAKQAAPERANAAAAKTLLFFGDSLTAGHGLEPEQAFPALLGERLKAAGRPWKTINAGVSGDTTRTALARVDWALRTKPDVIFICLGGNDGLRGINPEETLGNLEKIITQAQKSGAKVLLAGMRMPGNYGAEHTAAFEAVYETLAKKYELPFLKFLLKGVALDPKLNLPDGIHPNVEGQKIVADTVWGLLDDQLKPLESST